MKKKKRRTHLPDREIEVIKVKIGDREYTADVASDLYVTDNMDKEFDRNPSLFAWYASMAEDALSIAKKAKLRLKNKFNEKVVEFRKKQRSSSGRITVEEMKARVAITPTIMKLEMRLINAETVAGKLKSYKEAFAQRKDMLISKGAHRRAEGEFSLKRLEGEVRRQTNRNKKEK